METSKGLDLETCHLPFVSKKNHWQMTIDQRQQNERIRIYRQNKELNSN